MIQRIQTVYLAIAIILLSIVTTGVELFSYVTETTRYTYTVFGVSEIDLASEKLVEQHDYPMYIATIALVLSCFITLMAYKNVKRQFKLGRSGFYTYFLLTVALVVMAMVGDSLLDLKEASRELGIGFFLFVAGFPFTFLANTGIKRDKNLLDSLDRLR